MQREVLSPLAEILLSGDATAACTLHLDVHSEPAPDGAEGGQEAVPEELIFTITAPDDSSVPLTSDPGQETEAAEEVTL